MKYYSVNEIATLLGRSPRTIRDWIETGCKTPGGHIQLEAVKIGRWWSVSEEAFVLFQHRLKVQSTTHKFSH
jgi:predicted transcriptional regulator